MTNITKAVRRGFTVLELLAVIAIISVLAGLLIVSVRSASTAAREASTVARLSSISKAIAAFSQDHGYVPPILRNVEDRQELDFRPPGPAGSDMTPNPSPPLASSPETYSEEIQSWYSITSLPVYLLGTGSRETDGYGYSAEYDPVDSLTERPSLGIRSPGPDGAWGSTVYSAYSTADAPNIGWSSKQGMSLESDRISSLYFNGKFRQLGPVYGPYLGLEQKGFIGKVLPLDPFVEWELGDEGPEPYRLIDENSLDWDNPESRLVLLDGFGNPIEYFRKPYAPSYLSKSDTRDFQPSTPSVDLSSLADVIRLRPFAFISSDVDEDGQELATGAYDSRLVSDLGPDARDSSTSVSLKTAPFALFSSGADRTYNAWVRSDPSNEDNIVEIGK